MRIVKVVFQTTRTHQCFKKNLPAAGDSNPTRFIAGFQRILPLPPYQVCKPETQDQCLLFNLR